MHIGERMRTTGEWLLRLGTMAAVAAVAVGFSVGDASPAPSKDAATTAAPDQAGQEDLHWTWTIPAGKTIEIKGVNGTIRARRTSGAKVDVRAWKHANHSDPAEVKVEFVQHDGGITVCAVYPGSNNDCEPGDAGHMNTHNNDVVVDFEVQVPAGVGFTGRTVNGSVEAESLDGPILARTVNGHVEVSTSKRAEASTVNGSITARMGSTAGGDGLEFSTVNGSITLDLPETVNADLSASTVNGSIQTDFPVTVQGTFNRHRIEGTLGKGGMDLKLQTVNGSIRLRKASI
ncbi:MAG TPA: DUF4097 family beta strand repeat-containing protein [Candidatus Eisenbacteria bacterium]